MQQHVSAPTYCLGGTLDLIATFSVYNVDELCVDLPGIISDHSVITSSLPSRRHSTAPPVRAVRSWRTIDRAAFRQAIMDSCLGRATPSSRTADELFSEYDTVLRSLADRLALSWHTKCTAVSGPMRPGSIPCNTTPVSQVGAALQTDRVRHRSFSLLCVDTPQTRRLCDKNRYCTERIED